MAMPVPKATGGDAQPLAGSKKADGFSSAAEQALQEPDDALS